MFQAFHRWGESLGLNTLFSPQATEKILYCHVSRMRRCFFFFLLISILGAHEAIHIRNTSHHAISSDFFLTCVCMDGKLSIHLLRTEAYQLIECWILLVQEWLSLSPQKENEVASSRIKAYFISTAVLNYCRFFRCFRKRSS